MTVLLKSRDPTNTKNYTGGGAYEQRNQAPRLPERARRHDGWSGSRRGRRGRRAEDRVGHRAAPGPHSSKPVPDSYLDPLARSSGGYGSYYANETTLYSRRDSR